MSNQTPRVTDLFAGCGGSSQGLKEAGANIQVAINHNKVSLTTHAYNHPNAMHDCVEIEEVDPRRYPKCDILWASPECRRHSTASGIARTNDLQLPLWTDDIQDEEGRRSRATMYEVVRFAQVMQPTVIFVENVVEVVKWAFYSIWWQEMLNLGYKGKTLYLNAAHFGTPSQRDRYFAVFWRGTREPDLDPRPPAFCHHCDKEVWGKQTWKPNTRAGKYKKQYIYCCPYCQKDVTPHIIPAASIIDWSNTGERIADRNKPLHDNTITRIRAGFRKYGTASVASQLAQVKTAHSVHPDAATTIAPSPFIISYYGRKDAHSPVTEPLPTITPANRHRLVTTAAFITEMKRGVDSRSVSEPLSTIYGAPKHRLVTTTADNQYPLTDEEIDALLPDCYTRFLTAHELKLAMGFPNDYILHGPKNSQVSQVGHAVAVPVARWLAHQVMNVL